MKDLFKALSHNLIDQIGSEKNPLINIRKTEELILVLLTEASKNDVDISVDLLETLTKSIKETLKDFPKDHNEISRIAQEINHKQNERINKLFIQI